MAVVGVGVDVVELDRIARAYGRHGARFLQHLYSPQEIAYCSGKRPPAMIACLAARFAAKEAVMKALGTGRRGVSFREIAVVNRRSGRPDVELKGRAADVARLLGVDEVILSVSHGRDVAVVVALAIAQDGEGHGR